jgi:hypothetical protein
MDKVNYCWLRMGFRAGSTRAKIPLMNPTDSSASRFRYHPKLGGYPDLYNHCFSLSALGAASFIGHI